MSITDKSTLYSGTIRREIIKNGHFTHVGKQKCNICTDVIDSRSNKLGLNDGYKCRIATKEIIVPFNVNIYLLYIYIRDIAFRE